MKKIAIILTVVVACIISACQPHFEPSVSLALDNQELDLPRTIAGENEFVHYARVTSNGEWEAILETEDGNPWCWLQEYYVDAKGNKIKVVEPVKAFDGMDDRWCIVKGKGTVFLPLRYLTTSAVRYAVLTVRRTDTGETCKLFINQ